MAPIKCFGCGNYINKKSTSELANNARYRQFLLNTRAQREAEWVEPADHSRMCNKCYSTFRRQGNPEPADLHPNENGENVAGRLKLSTNQLVCCVCGDNIRQRIPTMAVLKLWMQFRIFCHPENRSCPVHLENGLFSEEAVGLIRLRATPRPLSAHENEALVNLLTDRVSALEKQSNIFNFDSQIMEDEDYKCLTGLNRAQFNTLVEQSGDIRTRKDLSKKNCIALFLVKLRVDPSQKVLGMMFGMKPKQQPRISEIFHDVLVSLTNNFVPHHLGYGHITREDYAEHHSTTTSNRLCRAQEDSLVVLVDATYLYHQKPSDHIAQRKTYCLQKRENLVKFSVVIAPDGYIMDVSGPHASDAANNDSSIFNAMALNDNGFLTFFRENDNIIYDRGYRDSTGLCQNVGLNVFMPHFLPNGQRQLTTQQANESRLVTMLRWVIEAVFGRLQNKFRFLKNVVPNSYECETLSKIFQVACAISNSFFSPISENGPDDDAFCDRVLEIVNRPNNLLERVMEENLLRRRIDWPLVYVFLDLQDFPVLSENEIQDLTHGTYQIRLAYSYTSAHLNNGQYLIRLHLEPGGNGQIRLVRASIPSRFQAAEERKCFIQYNTTLLGIDSITGWACLCKSGARVLGMCGHVCSVIWFLSYGRHHPEIRYPLKDKAENTIDVRR